MIDVHAAFCHHLLQVAVAERIGQVPANTEQNDFPFEAVTFEVDHAGSCKAIRWARSLPKSGLPLLTQHNPMESWFNSFKNEWVHGQPYRDRDQQKTREMVFEYIEVFYNRKRRHSSLGYFSPSQFLAQWMKEQEIGKQAA